MKEFIFLFDLNILSTPLYSKSSRAHVVGLHLLEAGKQELLVVAVPALVGFESVTLAISVNNCWLNLADQK
jgi:hypothetical protein